MVGYHDPSEFEPPTGMKYGFLPQLSSLAARIAPNFCQNRAEREQTAKMVEMAKIGKNVGCDVAQYTNLWMRTITSILLDANLLVLFLFARKVRLRGLFAPGVVHTPMRSSVNHTSK